MLGRVLDQLALRRLSGRLVFDEPPPPPAPRTSEWQLIVPFTEAINAGALAANAVVTGSRVNLLGFDRPTIMQEWRLRSISVPVGVTFTQAAGEHPNAVVVVTAVLRYGSDPVWTAAGSTERGSVTHNLVLTDRLDPAIVVRAGRTLTLEVNASCYEAVTALKVLLAGRFGAAAAAEAADGTVDYQAVSNDGRRRL